MLNSNEVRLLLSELRLEGSLIQKVTEHDWHSWTFSMYSMADRAWLWYFEIGTQDQHFCRTDVMRRKSQKAQRFTQYLRANIVGSRIVAVEQPAGERAFTLTLSHAGEERKLHFRFFSGPGANCIVTDKDDMILELQLRRPGRLEEKGQFLPTLEDRQWNEERFPVRAWQGESFNSWLDHYYREGRRQADRNDTLSQLEAQRDRELSLIRSQIRDERTRLDKSAGYEVFKETGDLLSSNAWAIDSGKSSVRLTSFSGEEVVVELDPKLSVSGNINAYYQKYKRQERIHESAAEELKRLEEKLEQRTQHYARLLEQGDEAELSALHKELRPDKAPQKPTVPGAGLRFTSSGFEILVGRNAKENDTILRRLARSNDTWLHVRDFAGGYVVIRAIKGKSIPLDVLLDAANLAIHYSKAKSQGKADLYYTQVKFLRRIKDGKTGLVTPTQEKNLFVTMDESRLKRLLLVKEEQT